MARRLLLLISVIGWNYLDGVVTQYKLGMRITYFTPVERLRLMEYITPLLGTLTKLIIHLI